MYLKLPTKAKNTTAKAGFQKSRLLKEKCFQGQIRKYHGIEEKEVCFHYLEKINWMSKPECKYSVINVLVTTPRSWKQLKESEESQGRINIIYSGTPFFRMLQSLHMLVLRTHTSTSLPQAQSMKDSLRLHCLCNVFTSSFTVVHKTPQNSWISIILEMV